ncbi:MAG: hypothetical protein PHD37_06475 [Gallionellaceae bacterium]|nr:hypothetical protein [Gallionellaceae bacterium]
MTGVKVEHGHTFEQLMGRLLAGEQGDDVPIVMEAFGCNYEAACDAIFTGDHQEAIAMLNAAIAAA